MLSLLIGEFLAGCNQLWGHIFQIKTKEQEEENIWVHSTLKSNEQVSEIEKSVQDSLSREMSDMPDNSQL